jgi:hypothetical protein
VQTVAELAELLKTTRRAILQQVAGLSHERAVTRPSQGEWCVLEVLAHFIDTDYNYTAEALAMRNGPNHMLVYFDDTAWRQKHAGIRETPVAEILASLAVSHEHVLGILASMSDDDLDAPGLHPRGIPYTVRDIFLRLPIHDENHARQVEEIVAAI